MASGPAIAVLSLETWDHVWRRNQHLASRLVKGGWVESLTFITPPDAGFSARPRTSSPMPGITVVTPPLLLPRRFGGYRLLARWLRRRVADADLVWVNDPVGGAALIGLDLPLVYDVTDDWRSMPQSSSDRRRTVAAEDALARAAKTVVCSPTLADRWRQRYGVNATVVPNGVDGGAIEAAAPRRLTGPAPHAVYVGTLHENRIDIDLVTELVDVWPGTVHLVGPQHLGDTVVANWRHTGAEVPGPVPSAEVPTWLKAADVLICPHLVDEFTLSLDAIKAHEYLATDRPVVATPSSGFQGLRAPGLAVARDGFVDAALAAASAPGVVRSTAVDWDERADAFAAALGLKR